MQPLTMVELARHRVLAAGMLAALVVGALFFSGLGAYPLLDPDEGRHAEVAREMAGARGLRRLVLPTLGLAPYREKPPTYYGLVTLAYGIGGVTEAAARSVSAAAAFVAVLAAFAWAAPRAGAAGALGAALVLATSLGWFGLARYANLDMTLTAVVTVGVLAGLAWLERPAPRRPPLLPYLAAGLATLVKGPVGAVLVAGPLALALLVRRPRPAWGELGLARGLALGALVVATLYVPLGLLDPSYLRAFLATNVRRFTPASRHAEPFWYYLIWMPVLFFPWTLLAVPALGRAARDPARRPLVLWAAFVPAVLTLARGKLASYALSALVPLALVVGPELVRVVRGLARAEDARMLTWGGWVAVAALAAGGTAALVLGRLLPVSAPGHGLVTTVALGWAAALGVALAARRLHLVPIAVLGATLTLYPLLVSVVAPAAATLYSDRDAAWLVNAAGRAPVIAFAAQAPSLAFYLGTPPITTDDTALVQDLFAHDAPVFLVTGRRHFEEIERLLGARAVRWYGTPRRRLYANRPPPGPLREKGSR